MRRSLTFTALLFATLAPQLASADPIHKGRYNGCPASSLKSAQCDGGLSLLTGLQLSNIKTLQERDRVSTPSSSPEATARRAAPANATVSSMAAIETHQGDGESAKPAGAPLVRRNAFLALLLSGGRVGR